MKKSYLKTICLVLALLLFAMMAMGSGSSGESNEAESKQSDSTADSAVNETPEKEPDVEQEEATPTETKPDGTEYTISNEVIVDDENCSFKIIEAKDDSIWGFTLKVYCENKTADKTLMFALEDVSINGYLVDPFWADEVAAGKKSNEEVTFGSSALEDSGITSPDEITFTLRIHDSDDWSADAFVDDTFTVYPTGLTADQIVIPERKSTPTEQVIVDNDQVTFVILGTENDNIWGYTLNCYLENKTDKNLMFSWDDVSVNGYMIDPFFASSVAPGKRNYCNISFSTSDFEENNITDVEEIEFSMRIYDSEDWSADDIYNETLTYNP